MNKFLFIAAILALLSTVKIEPDPFTDFFSEKIPHFFNNVAAPKMRSFFTDTLPKGLGITKITAKIDAAKAANQLNNTEDIEQLIQQHPEALNNYFATHPEFVQGVLERYTATNPISAGMILVDIAQKETFTFYIDGITEASDEIKTMLTEFFLESSRARWFFSRITTTISALINVVTKNNQSLLEDALLKSEVIKNLDSNNPFVFAGKTDLKELIPMILNQTTYDVAPALTNYLNNNFFIAKKIIFEAFTTTSAKNTVQTLLKNMLAQKM